MEWERLVLWWALDGFILLRPAPFHLRRRARLLVGANVRRMHTWGLSGRQGHALASSWVGKYTAKYQSSSPSHTGRGVLGGVLENRRG